jgi:undecaprenyl phosphate-alpha-L-ara4N flippase subunit ArnE
MSLVVAMLLLSVLTNTIAQLSLKHGIITIRRAAAQYPASSSSLYRLVKNPFVILWAVLMGIAMFLWLKAISMADLSFAYPFLSLSLVLISLGSIIFLKEHMTNRQWAGVALILLGIVLISRS